MTNRRDFLTKAGLASAAGAAALAAPSIARAQKTIKWRFQTYAGSVLGEHVTKPIVDAINEAAKGELQVDLYYADQIVPTGELFRALQAGTIDAVHSDDDSMASPAEVSIFGGYFPMATKQIMDVPVLFNQYGLNKIWADAYKKVGGVVWLSSAGQDPCHFNTKKPITKLEDLQGLRLYTFPTAGRFLSQFGVVPVTLPYEDAQMAVQTGELDGMAWSGITEDYTVGWADVTSHFLTNNISGAWIGSYFVNEKRWADLPPHLKRIVLTAIDASHTYRNQWYWGGEAKLRATGTKLKLTSIPTKDWKVVEDKAKVFWKEVAQTGETAAKIVKIFEEYNAVIDKAGVPYTMG